MLYNRTILILLIGCLGLDIGYSQSLNVFDKNYDNAVSDSIMKLTSELPESYALHSVSLIDLENGVVRKKKTVTIKKGRITSVRSSFLRPVLFKKVAKDVKGKYLMTGLVDAHVHLQCSYVDRMKYTRKGITSVINFTKTNSDTSEVRLIENNKIPFPNIFGMSDFFYDNGAISTDYQTALPVASRFNPRDTVVKIDSEVNVQECSQIFNHDKGVIKKHKSVELNEGQYHTFMINNFLTEPAKGSTYRKSYSEDQFMKILSRNLRPRNAQDSIQSNFVLCLHQVMKKKPKLMIGTETISSDDKNIDHYYNELFAHQCIGMSNLEVLRSACNTPFKFLKKPVPLIRKKQSANLVLYQNNPLIDLQTIKDPHTVILRGIPLDKTMLNLIDKLYENLR